MQVPFLNDRHVCLSRLFGGPLDIIFKQTFLIIYFEQYYLPTSQQLAV